MNLTIEARLALMARLGQYLLSADPEWSMIKDEAAQANPWFMRQFTDYAFEQIAGKFLQPALLVPWVEQYPHLSDEHGLPPRVKKTVGIVMAGNIPAVGFHDFLCGFISGHRMWIRLSSKDEVLMRHVIEKLLFWEPSLIDDIQICDMLKGCDAYIATGSNNSARYFEYYFRKYPHIIRKNRTSVAILDGTEGPEELDRLSDDVFLYFGLGCRNVTKLYVPENHDFIPLLEAFRKYDYVQEMHKYKNNLDYRLTLHILNKEHYMSNGVLVLSENPSPFSPIGELHYETYKPGQAVKETLQRSEDIQCIVGRGGIPFGQTQQPALDDYADAVDTLAFLSTL